MTTQGVPETPAGPLARVAALFAALAIVAALFAALVARDDSGVRSVSLAGAPLEDDPFAYEPDPGASSRPAPPRGRRMSSTPTAPEARSPLPAWW